MPWRLSRPACPRPAHPYRTARLSLAAAGLLALSACGEVLEPETPRARVVIEPDSLVLEIGDTATIAYSVFDSAGVLLEDAPVTWTFTGSEVESPWSAGPPRIRGRAIGTGELIAEYPGYRADTLRVRVHGIGAALVEVESGGFGSCGLDDAGRAYCWGHHYLGVTPGGEGEYGGWTLAPAPVAGDLVFEELVVGHQHACGRTDTGATYCWYGNTYGQLGSDTGILTGSTTPVRVTNDRGFVALTTAGWHTCGLDAAGAAWCWGANDYAQIGDGTQADAAEPVAVAGDLRFVELSAHAYHTCGRQADGGAWCWGLNGSGQLGHASVDECADPIHGSVPCSRTPARVATDLALSAIEAGGRHTCGLDGAGAAYCWGSGALGELGDGSVNSSSEPVPVAGGHAFDEIRAAFHFTCGRTAAGAVWCWGGNDYGATGVDPAEGESCVEHGALFPCTLSPVRVGGDVAFGSLGAAGFHACGMTLAGEPLCWGDNGMGQLGVGTHFPSHSHLPQRVHDGDHPAAGALR